MTKHETYALQNAFLLTSVGLHNYQLRLYDDDGDDQTYL